jgi:N-acetylneuraminic acid mutarotase
MKIASRSVISCFSLLALLSSCGVNAPPEIEITITPSSAQVYVYYSVRLIAWLRNATNNNVTWSLSGNGCSGTECGTLSDTGLYTAPRRVPATATVTVTATSVENPSKSATATLTIMDGPFVSDQWTWVAGSDFIDDGGSRGIKGVANPSNVPGSRSSALSWSGPGGELWLFGGSAGGYGMLNDLWRYDLSTDEWTWVSGGDHADQPGIYGTKGTAYPSNVPGGREWASGWIDASSRLWLFGGMGYDSNGDFGQLNDLWRYDPAANDWTWVSGSDHCWESGHFGTRGVPDPANFPAARWGHVSWIDPAGDVWIFGGKGVDASPGQLFGAFNDLWKFEPDTLEWTWISGTPLINQAGIYGVQGMAAPSNAPGSRYWATSWTDHAGNLWLLGGAGYDSAGIENALNDLWKFDPVTQEWTWISGSNLEGQVGTYGIRGVSAPSNFPGARAQALSCVDSAGLFWLFGGYGRGALEATWGNLNDLWKFDPALGQWTWVSGNYPSSFGTKHIAAPSNMPPARNEGVLWTGSGGSLWLFGGYGSAQGFSGVFNDLWRYWR